MKTALVTAACAAVPTLLTALLAALWILTQGGLGLE